MAAKMEKGFVAPPIHSEASKPVLEEIELRLACGEVLALLGPNGAGKSTLFRLLSTLLPLDRGRLSVMGHDVSREPQAVRQCLRRVGAQHGLDPWLSGRENGRVQAALNGWPTRQYLKRCSAWLERWEFNLPRFDETLAALSSGNQQKVALALALASPAKLLILDEAGSGLDPLGQRMLGRAIREVADGEGKTVLMATHQLEGASIADRIVILRAGRIVIEGAPLKVRNSVRNGASLEEAYLHYIGSCGAKAVPGKEVQACPVN